MVSALTPLAIVFGGAIAAVLIFSSFWKPLALRLRSLGGLYTYELDVADINVKSQDLGFVLITIAALAWIGLVIVARPSFFAGALLLPMVIGLTLYGIKAFLRFRIERRIQTLRGQLEGIFRSLASGVRVGLGLRQALFLVAEKAKEPARKELTRVIGVANLGTSLFDALDEMGRRLPMAETQMLARVVRVQSQSGGDLGEVLDGLADTIRDRRRLERKISGLTSQSRATGWLLGLLPIFMLSFILLTQPAIRHAVFTTSIGLGSVILGLALDAAAIFFLARLMRFDA
jgi:tight adherence protein B